ncbi:diguanylate cyclase [Candidatus Omnitrophota bacterium]
MPGKTNTLIVSRDEAILGIVNTVLGEADYAIWSVGSEQEGLDLSKENQLQIVIADLDTPEFDGIKLIERLKAEDPNICVIVVIGDPSAKSAVEAIRRGAYDYMTKPLNSEETKIVLSRAAERQRLLEEAGKKEYYRELSIIDGLTGVYNYRYFYEILPREVERAKRYPQEFSLLMLDIDGFKDYNDTHGHLAGDKMLRQLGHFFMESIRAVDMVFRYGGEEFAIILPQTPQAGAATAAKRLLTMVKKRLPITVSIGVASFPSNAESREELIEKADRALYQAKLLGKDRAFVYGAKESA